MAPAQNLLPGIPLVESPLFTRSLDQMGLTENEREIAQQLHTRGYAVIDFPDADILARIDRVRANLTPRFGSHLDDPASIKAIGDQRIQDAWTFDEDVMAIAASPGIVDLLSKLYGRRAFPFQTLNFPVGTQQHPHSDSIHFSSLPERFMCGVWLALEDIHPDAGPLLYLPGTHKWPIISNAMIGRRGFKDVETPAQQPFEQAWMAMVDAVGIAPETFLARKGQALIWAANLLHGGSPQHDPTLTRWSQVTHYYFDDCIYYTPAYSDEAVGQFAVRNIVDISTGKPVANRYLGAPITAPSSARGKRGRWHKRLARVVMERFGGSARY
ncbi:phytanoyl-CoA dioxygenase family protein [Sphingomonas qilianensis]